MACKLSTKWHGRLQTTNTSDKDQLLVHELCISACQNLYGALSKRPRFDAASCQTLLGAGFRHLLLGLGGARCQESHQRLHSAGGQDGFLIFLSCAQTFDCKALFGASVIPCWLMSCNKTMVDKEAESRSTSSTCPAICALLSCSKR